MLLFYAKSNGLEKITKKTIVKIKVAPFNSLLPLIIPTILEITDNSNTKNPGKYQNILVNIIEMAKRNDNIHKIIETKLILFNLIHFFPFCFISLNNIIYYFVLNCT